MKTCRSRKGKQLLKKSSGILCEGNRLVAYRFVSKHRNFFGLRWLLRRLNIPVNAYYNHLKYHKKEYQIQKDRIHDQIKKIYHETGSILGHRSMRIFLKREGIVLSKTTVHKYMNKELELICICRRKRPGYKKGNAHKLFPNLLNQDFNVTEKNKVWCADFTYIKLTNGLFRYNCSIIDLHERCVVATQTAKWITREPAIETLKKAIVSQDIDTSKLIFHTDQGVQFTSLAFTDFCRKKEISQSMSKAGCPYDNAPMERFYNTMKEELIYRYHFHTDEELISAISKYVYVWYNQIRPHSYNGYLTPLEARNLN